MKDKKKENKGSAKSDGDQFSFQLDSTAEGSKHEHLTQQQIAEKDESTLVLAADPSNAANAPWDLVSENSKMKHVPLPMDGKLYAKMNWLTNNLPKMSLQKLALTGTIAYVDALIKEHYKG
jgi:lipopolysaccharide export LptBFGC system permease protein LptF